MLNAQGCKKKRLSKQYGKRNQLHFKEEEKKKEGLGRRAPVEISQENRRVESYLKEARIPPPSIALALSDMVMLIGDTGEGGSLHQHASEHHRAWVMIRIVH